MKKILIPCDFSETAQEAFKFAIQLAEEHKNEIHVLYVIDMTFLGGSPSLSHAYTFNVQFMHDLEYDAKEKFQKMWEKYAPITLAAKYRHKIGTLANEVRNYVDENNIDMVVMGTTGTGRSKWGSNVEKIVRTSPVPVLAIRRAPARPVQNIVVPVGMIEPDEAFVDQLKELQRMLSGNLHLLYVNTPTFFTKDSTMHKRMQKFIERYDLMGCTTHFRSDMTVQEGIARFVKEKSYDMIAMGTHGWKGLAHFLFGSVAEDVVNGLEVPVWTCALERGAGSDSGNAGVKPLRREDAKMR